MPLVWLAIIQVLVVTTLASSPELHGHFHLSSHDSDHQCLVTDFKSGLIEQPLVVPISAPCFAPRDFQIVALAADARHSLPEHLRGSLLEHGPPAFA
ncbi:MAG: hypothetical protein DVB25_03895 [Verrucomicrobia bacterium]|nr:MAG: hypothetical protein DVB25_03895 [Verrucomicrobiota bacterium]